MRRYTEAVAAVSSQEIATSVLAGFLDLTTAIAGGKGGSHGSYALSAALEQALDVTTAPLIRREWDCPACDGQGFHDNGRSDMDPAFDYAECEYCCGIGVVLS